MERMEHFRGQLFNGDQVLLDSVEGYLGCHAKSGGQKTWFGNFELPADQRGSLSPSTRYRLAMIDGRSGDLYVDVHDSNTPGKCTAEFQLIGALKEKKSLRH